MSEYIRELHDRFADAAMELLMDQYAQEEGNRLLAKYPEPNPEDTMWETLDRRCQKVIQKSYQHMLIGSMLKHAARAAACILLSLTLAFQLAMSVEAFRVPVLNFILKQEKKFTQITFSQNTGSFAALDQLRVLIWESVPDGYQLKYEKVHTGKHLGSETVTGIFVRFQNDQDAVLDISVTKAEGTTNIDSEDASVTSLELFGQQTVLVAKEGELRAIWVNEDQGQMYSVIGYGTGPDPFWEYVHRLIQTTQNPPEDISF